MRQDNRSEASDSDSSEIILSITESLLLSAPSVAWRGKEQSGILCVIFGGSWNTLQHQHIGLEKEMKEQDAVGRIFGFAGFSKMPAQEQPIVGQLQKRVDAQDKKT